MRCPICNGMMQSGSAVIARSTARLILDVLTGDLANSASCLYFTADGGGASTFVDHSRRIYRCPECEAVLIAGTKQD
jgi:hypothetical protein